MDWERFFRASTGFIFFLQFVGIIVFNRRSGVPNVVMDDREPRWIVWIRAPWVIIMTLLILLHAAGYPVIDFAALHLPAPVRAAGIVLGLIIDLCIFWTLFSLGRNISTTLSLGEGHELIVRGPYALVRHPLYSLGIPLFVSLTLVSSNWFIGLAGIGFQVFVMLARTPLEEQMLEEYFGEAYRDYRKRAGMFFPRIMGRRGGH